MKLIVGLGNPGKKYEKTRHNVGFMVLDAMQERFGAHGITEWSLSKKFNAEVAGFTAYGEKYILAKPMTFMNDSGQSVGLIMQFYKMTKDDLTVIHDDKDIPLGEYKTEKNRGDAGHNGIKSITEHVGTKDYARVRMGIAKEDSKKMSPTPKFVLGKFSLFERPKVQAMIQAVVEETDARIHGGRV